MKTIETCLQSKAYYQIPRLMRQGHHLTLPIINQESHTSFGDNTILHELAALGKLEALKKHCKRQQCYPIQINNQGFSTLHWAIIGQNRACIDYLLEHNQDFLALNHAKENYLHWIARKGDIKSLTYLKHHLPKRQIKFLINQKNELGFTPLHFAAANTHKEMVTFLIELGADLTERNQFDANALHWLLNANSTNTQTTLEIILKTLHHHYSKFIIHSMVNQFNAMGFTPLHWALWHNLPTAVATLMSSGASLDQELGIFFSPRVFIESHKNTVSEHDLH